MKLHPMEVSQVVTHAWICLKTELDAVEEKKVRAAPWRRSDEVFLNISSVVWLNSTKNVGTMFLQKQKQGRKKSRKKREREIINHTVAVAVAVVLLCSHVLLFFLLSLFSWKMIIMEWWWWGGVDGRKRQCYSIDRRLFVCLFPFGKPTTL